MNILALGFSAAKMAATPDPIVNIPISFKNTVVEPGFLDSSTSPTDCRYQSGNSI